MGKTKLEDLVESNQILIREIASKTRSLITPLHIYLFGGYAKGRVKPTSDIDLLILMPEHLNNSQLKEIRIETIDMIEEQYDYEIEIDMKVYNKSVFEDYAKKIGFENSISKYMIEV